MAKKTIMIVGGHATSALAVIDELIKKRNFKIIFVGRKTAMEGDKATSFEFRQIKKRRIQFIPLTSGRVMRYFTPFILLSLLKIPVGFIKSFFIIWHFKPHVVVSFGGYLAVPLVVIAKIFRKKVITHEQTATPGLANRLISFFSDKVCIGIPSVKKNFPGKKTIFTGNPLRQEFLENKEKKVVDIKKPLIYISGGSLGAHVINRVVAQILPKLLGQFTVVHQCGDSSLTRDYSYLKSQQNKLPAKLAKYYLVRDYFQAKEVVWLLKNSSLVVSRAGANTVAELAYMGKSAILIPLPFAAGKEQHKNAQLLIDAGLAVVIRQEDLTSDLLFKTIINVVQRKNRYADTSVIDTLVNPQAAKHLADIIAEA